MTWLNMVGVTLLVVGAAGFCVMAAAFVLIARQGWQQAIQQPIAEGRWTPARRLIFVGAASGLVFIAGWWTLSLIPGALPWSALPPANTSLAERLVGKWEMADGSDYVVEFTRDGMMSVGNKAGESQLLLGGDEFFRYEFISDTVVRVPNRGLDIPDNVAFEEAEYFFVFSVSVDQDRLTIRGQPEGETIILTQDDIHKVRFPGSESQPLEFIRRK